MSFESDFTALQTSVVNLYNNWQLAHASNATTLDQIAVADSVGAVAQSLTAVVADVAQVSPIAQGLISSLQIQTSLGAITIDAASLTKAINAYAQGSPTALNEITTASLNLVQDTASAVAGVVQLATVFNPEAIPAFETAVLGLTVLSQGISAIQWLRGLSGNPSTAPVVGITVYSSGITVDTVANSDGTFQVTTTKPDGTVIIQTENGNGSVISTTVQGTNGSTTTISSAQSATGSDSDADFSITNPNSGPYLGAAPLPAPGTVPIVITTQVGNQLTTTTITPGSGSDQKVYDTSSGSPVLQSDTVVNSSGTQTTQYAYNDDGSLAGAVITTASPASSSSSSSANASSTQATTQVQLDPAAVAQAFGSALGNIIANGNELEAIPLSTALGVTLGTFANLIKDSGSQNVSASVQYTLQGVPQDVEAAGADAIASYISAELVNALGIRGVLSQALDTVSGAALGTIAANLAMIASGVTQTVVNGVKVPLQWDTNLATNIEDGIGGFVGSELASLVLPASSEDSAIGGELVGAVGTVVGAEIGAEFGAWGGPIGAAIGAFVGTIAGTLFGGLFGPGKGTPWASADISVSPIGINDATFVAGSVSYKHNAPVATVQNLVAQTVQVLNSVLGSIGGTVISPGAVPTFQMSIWNGIPRYQLGGIATSNVDFSDVGGLEAFAVTRALNQLLNSSGIAGGDTYVKRALESYLGTSVLNSSGTGTGGLAAQIAAVTNALVNPTGSTTQSIETGFSALSGDIAVAQDYEDYVDNTAAINALIAASPNSAFTAGWLVTLEAADALGLDQRSPTDWSGGWKQFLTANDGAADELSISYVSNARLIIVGSTTIADTIPTNAKDIITDNTANDTISINATGTLQANSNVLFNGTIASTAQVSQIAAVIYAGPGNAVVYAGGEGDDVIGYTGTGYGNEYLVAGSMQNGTLTLSQNATWLFAGAGNDTLQGGNSGSDMLEGGIGNDLMLAGGGSVDFVGGSGKDTMDGNNAGDIFQIGQGSTSSALHSTLINPGADGNDTIVFGFGDGQATVTGAGSGDNVLSLGAGITWSNLQVSQPSGTDNLEFSLLNNNSLTGDSITFDNWFSGDVFSLPYANQWLQFADGTMVQLGAFHFTFGAPNTDLLGVPGNNLIVAGSGDSSIDAWLGQGVFDAGVGDDSISGGVGDDTIIGNAGDDTLFGGLNKEGGTDLIQAGTGADLLIAGANGDTMIAGIGSDTFIGGGGNDVINYAAGDGLDEILNPLTINTTGTVLGDGEAIWSAATGWATGVGWTQYATGAADGGGYQALNYINAGTTTTIIDTRNFGINPEGLDGYLEYNRTTQTLYWWSPSNVSAASKGSGDSTLAFGPGITESDLVFQRSGNNLVIGVRTAGDLSTPVSQLTSAITLTNYFTEGTAIQTLLFSNGGTLDLATAQIYESTSDAAQVVSQPTNVSGNVLIYGGAGNDTLVGGTGNDTIIGGGGNNVIEAGTGSLATSGLLEAGNGNNIFVAGSGNDTFVGGAGSNSLSFASATSAVVAIFNPAIAQGVTQQGAAAGDAYTNIGTVSDGGYADTIYGAAGGMSFDAGSSAGVRDTFYGSGNDVFQVHATGSVTINEMPGSAATNGTSDVNSLLLDVGQVLPDLYFAASGQTLEINNQVNGSATATANYAIDNFFTSGGADGGTGEVQDLYTPNGLLAPLGNIVLTGTATGSANAFLVGNVNVGTTYTPQYVLNASASTGDDLLLGAAGNDTLIGGAGNDTFEGGGGSNVIQGSSVGTNTVIYADVTAAVNVNLKLGTAYANGSGGTDTLLNIQNVVGSPTGNDTIVGGTANAVIIAGNGNASISGGFGADTLIGGTGADTIYGGTGSGSLIEANPDNGVADPNTHVLVGQGVFDTIYGGSSAGDQIIVNSQTALVYGGPGLDTITAGNGNDTIEAGPSGAHVTLGSGTDLVVGTTGDDAFYGGDGNDTLEGGSGQNLLYAGAGQSTLINSSGSATMYGGAGRDTFVVDAQSGQTVINASSGVDDLVLQNGSSGTPLSINDIWFAQQGTSLVISVIGATAQVTIQNFFTNSTSTEINGIPSVRRVLVGDQELFLDSVGNLMTSEAQSLAQDQIALDTRGVPVAMPIQTTDALSGYWFSTSGTAADSLTATAANQTIVGGNGNNLITSSTSGSDVLIAGPGNDTLSAFGNNNALMGGAGNDSLSVSGSNNWLDAGSGNSVLLGSTGSNVLLAGTGADTLIGNGGDTINPSLDGADTLIGGSGNNELLIGGGSSNTFLTGSGNATVMANGQSNTIYIDGAGYDTIFGNAAPGALTTVSYVLAPGPIDVAIGSGADSSRGYSSAWSNGDVFSNVNGIVGSPYGGLIFGSGGGGDDSLVATDGATTSAATYIDDAGSYGNDTLQAGVGNDTLVGGVGNDVLIGGRGNDSIVAGNGSDTIESGSGNDYLQGGTGSVLYIVGPEFGNDTISNATTNSALSFVTTNPQGIVSGINYVNLWFEQQGNNLIITEIGQPGQITVSNWFSLSPSGNVQISIIDALHEYTTDVNVSGLVTLMAGYSRPTDMTSLGNLLANSPYATALNQLWDIDQAPTITQIGTVPAVQENGTLDLTLDLSHLEGGIQQGATNLVLTASSSNTSLIDPVGYLQPSSEGTTAANGTTVTIPIAPNADITGTTTLTITATDQAGNQGTYTVPITVNEVNLAPQISGLPAYLFENFGTVSLNFMATDGNSNATVTESVTAASTA